MIDYNKKSQSFLTSKDKFHIELGLKRISRILEAFGNPQDKIRTIHIAGTNGKGSVCTILSEILQQSGYKTGLFTSPHITKYTERIKINGNEISDRDFYELLILIDKKCKEINVYLTEFEIITVAGFLWFEKQKVDIAVIEVGLGGRLDATNVIKKPVFTVITSISLDHTERLGDTIEKIAFEKAGIIKQNTPCVIGVNNCGLDTVKKIADERKSELIIADKKISLSQENEKNYVSFDDKKYEFSLWGKYQEQNLALVLSSIEILNYSGFKITEEALIKALKKVHHTARFEMYGNLIIDGAHNPDGAKMLRSTLNNLFPDKPIVFIYAVLNTKDYKSVLNNLLTTKDEICFLEFNHSNAVSIEELAKICNKKSRVIKNSDEILKLTETYKAHQIPVVLTGSLYAIGQVYKDLIKNYPVG